MADEQTTQVTQELDLTQVAILFQRRYNILQDVRKFTNDLGEAADRGDEVSVNLVLRMRADKLEALEDNHAQLLMLGETDPACGRKLRELLDTDPTDRHSDVWEEEKIYDLRRRIRQLITEIQAKDRAVNVSIAKEKSNYNL